NGEFVAEEAEGGKEDAEKAILAAREAFESGVWSGVAATMSGDFQIKVAEEIERRKDEFVRALALHTGKRLVEAAGDMDDIANCCRYNGKIADSNPGRIVDAGDPTVLSRVAYEPMGVCGMITPWNFPLLQASWKIAPALATSNSFVI